jgi:hypothetical protein
MKQCDTTILLVATHPRSGTHFLINSLCLNFAKVVFQPLRSQYPTLERLVLDHDAAYSKAWEAYLAPQPGVIKVVKTHMTPEDMASALEPDSGLAGRDRCLMKQICESAQRVYVCRDGRDALLSWYHYVKDFGGGLPNDLPPRLAECSLGEFIRMPNRYHIPTRRTQAIDTNRVAYWKHHVETGMDEPGSCSLSFESLRSDFDATLNHLAKELKWEDRRLRPFERPALVRPARSAVGRLLLAARRRAAAARHAKRGVAALPPSPAWAQRGNSGTWKQHYRPEDLEFFDEWGGDALGRLESPGNATC